MEEHIKEQKKTEALAQRKADQEAWIKARKEMRLA